MSIFGQGGLPFVGENAPVKGAGLVKGLTALAASRFMRKEEQ